MGDGNFSRLLIRLRPFMVCSCEAVATTTYHYYVSSVPIGLSPLRQSQSTAITAKDPGRHLHVIICLLGIP